MKTHIQYKNYLMPLLVAICIGLAVFSGIFTWLGAEVIQLLAMISIVVYIINQALKLKNIPNRWKQAAKVACLVSMLLLGLHTIFSWDLIDIRLTGLLLGGCLFVSEGL